MSELAEYKPTDQGSLSVITGGSTDAFIDFAKKLSVSGLLPAALRGKPADVFMALMEGLDLGLRPMQALNLIDVIQGRPCLKAEGKRALILTEGHEFRITEWTDEKCIVEGRRKGTDEWVSASFTAEQAQRAGLGGDNWKKYTADMLLARATSRLAKAYFADVTNGLATTEEMLDAEPPRPTLADVAAARADKLEPDVVDAEVVPPDEATVRAELDDIAASMQPGADAELVDAELVDEPTDGEPADGEELWPPVTAPGSGGKRK